MRIVAVSDLHGNLASVEAALDEFRPDALLCCGDWGDPGEVAEDSLRALIARQPTLTTFGNHDPVTLLAQIQNLDHTPILLAQAEVRSLLGVQVAAIGGIWAKSHKKPYYVTDDDVAAFADTIAEAGPVDILLTHGCPVGLADLTPEGRHGGQRCFLDATHRIQPRIHLCGHLHRAQERTLKDGRKVVNIGATPEGSVAVIDVDDGGLSARLETFAP